MNLNFNKVILLGRIASEIIYDEPNDRVSSLILVTNRRWKDRNGNKKEQATFHSVVFFGEIAGLIRDIGKKGEVLLVEGRLQHKEILDKNGEKKKDVSIVCEKFQLGSEKFEKDKIKNSLIDKQLDEWFV